MPANKPQNKPQNKPAASAAPQPQVQPTKKQRSAEVDVTPAGQSPGIQLPPALANLLTTLRDDRKNLLKEKPVTDEATTKFLAHFLYPRLIESVEVLGVGLSETYGVASQAFTETLRMRDYVDRKVEEMPDAPEGAVTVSEEDLDMLRQALAALGLMLQSKAPDDLEIQTAFNLVTEAFTAVAGDGAVDADDDDDDEDDDDEDADDDDDDDDEDEDVDEDDGDEDADEDEDETVDAAKPPLNGGRA